ncbi:MAG: hypothetical protein AVDCRST_MAG10-2458, partial [uncultured Acidimicrobiales bacterium]
GRQGRRARGHEGRRGHGRPRPRGARQRRPGRARRRPGRPGRGRRPRHGRRPHGPRRRRPGHGGRHRPGRRGRRGGGRGGGRAQAPLGRRPIRATGTAGADRARPHRTGSSHTGDATTQREHDPGPTRRSTHRRARPVLCRQILPPHLSADGYRPGHHPTGRHEPAPARGVLGWRRPAGPPERDVDRRLGAPRTRRPRWCRHRFRGAEPGEGRVVPDAHSLGRCPAHRHPPSPGSPRPDRSGRRRAATAGRGQSAGSRLRSRIKRPVEEAQGRAGGVLPRGAHPGVPGRRPARPTVDL